ncbi:MAG: type II toxin-antitoxin system RelE/ParE family toxin [Cyanothece sp. SIO1E1]|nr:type II toxin-antitoxin system RelE/ParE family toxin [Cyanothece sp. SIO1E1]
MKIYRTKQADLDLLEIWVFIAQDSIQNADNFIDRLEKRYSLLINQPELGPERPKLGKGIRVLVEGNYLIFYRISGDLIEIIRVLNAARNIQSLF